MSIVPWPTGARVRKIHWDIDQPGQYNRSQFTNARRGTILPFAPRWSAKVELAPIIGEANVLAWRAFLIDLDGSANSFYLPATEGAQITVDPNLVVDGASQGGFALHARGGTVGAALKRGMMISVGDLLLGVMANGSVGGDQKITLAVKPYLRVSPADGAPIAIKAPTCRVSLKDTIAGWDVDPGQIYGISFEVEEYW